jgi:predicted nucleic acid-binding protein
MSELPFSCVVDASVGSKLLALEDGSDQAHRLLLLLETRPESRFFVPDIFYAECANVVWKHVRRGHLAASSAEEAIASLGDLALQSVETKPLLDRAFALALAHGIAVYDALYLALAERLKLPLVTADERLYDAAAAAACVAMRLNAVPVA